MINTEIEFNIELNKNIYENSNDKTQEEFFTKYVLNYVASDYKFMCNLMKNKSNEEKEKYSSYLETLKNIKQSFLDSVTYELISEENNIDKFKVKLRFNYYENEISNLEQTVETEIFTRNIRTNYFLSEDIFRLLNSDEQKETAQNISNLYKNIGDLLTKAKSSVLINGKEFNFTSY